MANCNSHNQAGYIAWQSTFQDMQWLDPRRFWRVLRMVRHGLFLEPLFTTCETDIGCLNGTCQTKKGVGLWGQHWTTHRSVLFHGISHVISWYIMLCPKTGTPAKSLKIQPARRKNIETHRQPFWIFNIIVAKGGFFSLTDGSFT